MKLSTLNRFIAVVGMAIAIVMFTITVSVSGAMSYQSEDASADADTGVVETAANDAEKNVDIENWNFILGALQPLVLSLIINQAWSSSAKSVVGFAFTVITTTAGMYIAGDFSGIVDWVTTILAVFSASIVAYYGFYKPTGVAPKLEAATSWSTSPRE